MGHAGLQYSADPSSRPREAVGAAVAWQDSFRAPRQNIAGYLPGLDGWRAVAILAVIICHEPWVVPEPLESIKRGLGWGVYLFFAISGVLICTRLLEDEKRTGRFSLKAFYLRRLFRIQPAALVYLGTLAALMLAGIVHQTWRSWLGALLLYSNFLFDLRDGAAALYAGVLTVHFWTLAVEEHFYLLVALVLAFTRRRALAMTLLLLIVQVLDSVLERMQIGVSYTRATQWILPFLLFPTLVAILLQREPYKAFVVKYLLPWRVFVATPLAMLAAWALERPGPLLAPGTIFKLSPVLFYSCTFFVVSTMLHPQSWTTRVLELRPLRYLGRLSYSLYLWHVLFVFAAQPGLGITWAPLMFLSRAPWRYVASAVMTLASYYLVERPFIRIGHRLTASPVIDREHGVALAKTSPYTMAT